MSFDSVMAVIRPAFVVFGLVLMAVGVRTVLSARRRQRSWLAGSGRVVASRLDDGHIRLQVAFVHDGREVQFWNRHTSGDGRDPVGRAVDVLINPADPSDAVVVGGATGAALVGPVFVVTGAILVLIGVSLIRS